MIGVTMNFKRQQKAYSHDILLILRNAQRNEQFWK